MARVIQVDPADIAHGGRPTFKQGFPDERYDVIVMKVTHRSGYQAAQPGDILQFEGACYEVVSVFPAMEVSAGRDVGGVIEFHVNHKGVIPCG
jgi:sorbitol-specific phosphotransferase system component IIA